MLLGAWRLHRKLGFDVDIISCVAQSEMCAGLDCAYWTLCSSGSFTKFILMVAHAWKATFKIDMLQSSLYLRDVMSQVLENTYASHVCYSNSSVCNGHA